MPAGRPTKFKAEYIEQARKLCQLGATDRELADFFEIAESTLYLWKAENQEFSEALKVGKDTADDRVERSLYLRACGYTHPDVHVSNYQGEVSLTPIIKHYPPESVAGIFWLKNRRPSEWRDKREITGADGSPLAVQIIRYADGNAAE